MTEAPGWESLSLRKLRSSSEKIQAAASPDTDLVLLGLHCNYTGPSPVGPLQLYTPQSHLATILATNCLYLLVCRASSGGDCFV